MIIVYLVYTSDILTLYNSFIISLKSLSSSGKAFTLTATAAIGTPTIVVRGVRLNYIV